MLSFVKGLFCTAEMKSTNPAQNTLKNKEGPSKKEHSYAVLLVVITAISCCLVAISLYHVIIMKAEVASLRNELKFYTRQAASPDPPSSPPRETKLAANLTRKSSEANKPSFDQGNGSSQEAQELKVRTPRFVPAAEAQVLHACLQLIADNKRNLQQKGTSNTIPWILSFKRGAALEERQNNILVKETGYFFIYGQVWYQDTQFAMGHLIQRRKSHVVGDDPGLVTLFRCVQNMPKYQPNNSCYTAGIAKLEEGDEVLLTIPRLKANISLDGDGTFFGAIRLM
ncbi:tumor necrosis factor ligand superfamily member 13B [Ambystoma mexicanum]|uniref:tumor necrosis factor ligand superfamily member 13B n=1 Tax=Ambystoma mexicanum TaxID=8296 RepID=UPI0037E75C0C